MFLKISWNSQYLSTWVFFPTQLQAWPTILLQKRLQHIYEFFKKTYFVKLLRTAASGFWTHSNSISEMWFKNSFYKILSETVRKGIFFVIELQPFWTYLQYNDWSGLDEIICFSTGCQHQRTVARRKSFLWKCTCF